ncbi:MAG: META domain-containing protein [Cytophagales bacterium]|nr:META domain-containing protein [Cytophagales bacterium]
MSPNKTGRKSAQGILLTLSCLFTYSCTYNLYVAPKQVDCTGATAQKCYLIRSTSTGNWIMHYQDIQGFDYELGFSYKIKVRKENIKKAPSDGSTFRYILVEVLEQKDVAENIAVSDLLDKDWQLEYLIWNHTQYRVEEQPPVLKFEKDGKVSGNGGCNNLFSSFTLDGRTINMAEVGSTRMMCESGMEMEEVFMKILELELRAIFDDGKLVLSADSGNKLIFNRK